MKFLTKKLFIALILYLLMPGHLTFANEMIWIGKGQYFDIYSSNRFDTSRLLSRIDFNYFLNYNNVHNLDQKSEDILSLTFDSIYRHVSDVLEINVFSFHGSIYIYQNQAELAEFFQKKYGTQFPERSFFDASTNTIHISSEDITLGMLAHEMAHAIMTQYFSVPPPPKVQEILSGYVEFSLRKASGTLPK
ncbi:MAG: hypothetical protein HQL25_02305 [Candidatus Omnitrophica bacterium]|nr:hypothetical protein [Candidatus Omnitrophota bacterium]